MKTEIEKFWKCLFGTRPKQCNMPDVIHSITCGEPNKDGFADAYVNGEKTNLRLLPWDREDIERLQKIGKQIHKENDSK